jgi:monoamine oxidase
MGRMARISAGRRTGPARAVRPTGLAPGEPPYAAAMRVVVAGAGFAGLAAAEALHRAGVEVVVLEARDRVGGRVWSQVLPNGAGIERGAEFILPGDGVLWATAERLGLRLFEKGTLYGAREPRGGTPVSPGQLEGALVAIRAAAGEGRLSGTVASALDGLPIHPGAREVIRSRIEVSTAYPADDQEASVLVETGTGFGRFPTHTIVGGNQAIALALAARLGPAVRLSSPVRRIAWSEEPSRVRIATDTAELEADAVVLAVPASVTDRITFDPPLPESKQAALRAVRYGQAAKLFLPLVAATAPSATLSVPGRFWTFTQWTADGRSAPVAASFAGTQATLERLGLGDGPGRWTAAVRRLRPDLAIDDRDPVLATWHDDPWVMGAYSARSAASPMDDDALARPVGPIAFAGEHTAGERHALMDGALRSGLRAADDVLVRLGMPRPGEACRPGRSRVRSRCRPGAPPGPLPRPSAGTGSRRSRGPRRPRPSQARGAGRPGRRAPGPARARRPPPRRPRRR